MVSILDSYQYVMLSEYKRFMNALDEASANIIQNSLNLEVDEETTYHRDHIDRTKSIHDVATIMISLLWEDYIVRGVGDMLTGSEVDKDHKLVSKKPEERSQFETYTAALRGLLKNTKNSFLNTVLLPGYDLTSLGTKLSIVKNCVLDILKYTEVVSASTEEFLTWIEHGAELAASYTNASLDEGDEEVEPEEFYSDVRIRTYAYLKLSDYSVVRLTTSIQNIDGLLTASNAIADIFHQLYVSISPDLFEKTFNAMVSESNKSPRYTGTKFENVHELNEYIRLRLRESIEEPHGFMYNVTELLEETRIFYIDRMATEIIDCMAFLPDKKTQKRFVAQFESGKLWQKLNNHGE